MNEAKSCRTYVILKLQQSGWDSPPHSIIEQKTFTDGRIIPLGSRIRRVKQKRAFRKISKNAPRRPCMKSPLVRRPVEVQPSEMYLELGIRAFGNGTFHKHALSGFEV